MKKVYFLPVFFFAVFLSFAAHADALPDTDDVQKALAQPQIAANGFDLDKEALSAFYAARDNRPAWNFSGSENAKSFSAFIDSVDHLVEYHGLQRDDYPLDTMRKLAVPGGGGGVALELLVTDTLLKLARDLHGDSVDLADLYVGWDFHRGDIDIPAGLAAAVANNQLAQYIDSLSPKNPAYEQLAQILRIYRGFMDRGGWPEVNTGSSLRPGDRGTRVVQLRARLAAEDYLPAEDAKPVFDENLRKILADWQTRHGLEPDGHGGPKTIAALNIPLQTRIDQIRANMERWRHMPEAFPPARYTLVNIPGMTIDIVEDGKSVYSGIVIVGRVDRKTPFIQSNIRSMIVNPSWHVPVKIAQKDILPKLRKDPHYLEKLGFVIKGNEEDPHGEHIDWASMPEREFDFHLRQSPGDMNSLGRLKFDFDNDFSVYMHGTPHQELFKKYERTLSSGCVRLHDPEQVAQILLAGNKEPWDVPRIEEEIASNKTRWVAIDNPMPLYFLYWTVFADGEGRVNFRNDVYGYDQFLMETIAGDGRVDKPS